MWKKVRVSFCQKVLNLVQKRKGIPKFSIILNLERKRIQVTSSSKILNLVRKKIEVSFYKKKPFLTSNGRGTKPFPNLIRKRKTILP